MGVFKIKRRWYVDYYYKGKRVRKTVGSKKDAMNALAAIKADILREEYRFTTKPKVRFEDFAKEYLDYARANKKSWVSDSFRLKHLVPHLKGIILSRITAKDIEDYKQKRLLHVKPSTINREIGVLKFMFSLAIKWKYAHSNPVKEVKFFKEQEYNARLLDAVEAKQLIDCASTRIKPIIIIALNTGMRKGEILNLCWNDVDFDRGFISIQEAKSGKARKVPMNSLVRDTLKSIEGVNGEYPFYDPETESKRIYVQNLFARACKEASINNLRFHDLRHSAATWMVEAGVDLVTVKEMLGHSQIQTTMRYAHPTPESKLKAVTALERVLE